MEVHFMNTFCHSIPDCGFNDQKHGPKDLFRETLQDANGFP